MKARKFSYFHIAILIFILICLVSPIKINSYGHTRLRLDFYRAYAEDPTDINLSANTVAENLSVGTPVGILTTTDADPGDTFIYSFATGTGDTDNASFSINGDTLETAETFDFESKITYDIRIRSTDSTAGFTEKQFTITITNANDAPVCLPIELATNEDASGMALPDCTDAEDDSLTYAVASQPANGSAAVVNDNGNDKLEYTPVLNHNGTDPFTYQANDGELDSAPANVNVTVNPMNDAPVAQTQSVSTNEDEDKVIILVATDIDGDDLDYFIVLQPEPGSLNGTPPTVTYHPPLNYSGPDSFTFKANDGTIDSNIAEVSIDITPENDAPTNINLSGDHKVEEKIEPGVVVGSFSTDDVDSGPNFDYNLFFQNGCNSSGNSSFEIAGDSLKTKVVFDYEVQTFYWICVQTNDGNGGTFHKSFKIDILDKP
ncbi:MAG TPA: Ig-like domain-containing protein, partial [Anaerolineales bacterium]|nr:Ig-like domain-containing protein [Anaerolineales bacterium]